MPSIADITANNAAAANVTFNAVSPSSGDNTPAVWMANSLATVRSQRPVFSVTARKSNNKEKPGRKVIVQLMVPQVENVNGVNTIVAHNPWNLDVTIPESLPDTKLADNTAYFTSLVNSALVKSLFNTQTSAT